MNRRQFTIGTVAALTVPPFAMVAQPRADLSPFASRLRQAREAKGLSVEQAAKQAGQSPTTWQAWETATLEPKASEADLAAELLGTTVERLVRG
jgi:ribosome-binding protein aMBF1 (putative translation factor)